MIIEHLFLFYNIICLLYNLNLCIEVYTRDKCALNNYIMGNVFNETNILLS